MKTTQRRAMAALFVLAFTAALAAPALAQSMNGGKAPMYCYVGEWAFPRAQWADVAKGNAADLDVLQKAMAAGSIIGYGFDTNLVHRLDGMTHDDWWCATSMAGILGILDTFYSNGSSTSGVNASATKHYDEILVSRFYNWHPGTIKNGYSHVSVYSLKPDAPDDAVETLAKSAVVPLMEKLLSAGTISEYEIDEQAIHSDAPGSFYIIYLTQNASGIDAAQKALQDSLKANPMIGPAFGSMVDFSKHRDSLDRSDATYK